MKCRFCGTDYEDEMHAVECARECKDKVINILTENSRTTLTSLKDQTGIPISKLHYIVKELQEKYKFTIIQKG